VATNQQTPRPVRVPAPVVAAVLLVIAAGLLRSPAVAAAVGGTAGAIAAIIGLILYGGVAYGLWRGWRAAQIFAALGGGVSVLTGLTAGGDGSLLGALAGGAVAVLVLVPESARRWFDR
jgi:hypothetical protein